MKFGEAQKEFAKHGFALGKRRGKRSTKRPVIWTDASGQKRYAYTETLDANEFLRSVKAQNVEPLPCEPEIFGFCPNCGGKLDAFEMCDTRECLLQEKK